MDDAKAAISFGMGRAVTGSERVSLLYRDGHRYLLDAFSYYVRSNQKKNEIEIASWGAATHTT